MTSYWLIMLLALFLVEPKTDLLAAQANPQNITRQDSWILRFDGIGPVKVGMTLSQLNKVLGENFTIPSGPDDEACFVAQSARHPQVSFMIENGTLTRIDVEGKGIPSEKGIQVGDMEQQVLRVYGNKLKVEPHAYSGEEGGRYITVRDGQFGMRFETYQGKVDNFYAGLFTSIQYIEGCL